MNITSLLDLGQLFLLNMIELDSLFFSLELLMKIYTVILRWMLRKFGIFC